VWWWCVVCVSIKTMTCGPVSEYRIFIDSVITIFKNLYEQVYNIFPMSRFHQVSNGTISDYDHGRSSGHISYNTPQKHRYGMPYREWVRENNKKSHSSYNDIPIQHVPTASHDRPSSYERGVAWRDMHLGLCSIQPTTGSSNTQDDVDYPGLIKSLSKDRRGSCDNACSVAVDGKDEEQINDIDPIQREETALREENENRHEQLRIIFSKTHI
jgi:hypothetical protein